MYAFLSKVFGRKKDDKDASSSSRPVLGPGELLGGRFEAISRNVSPAPQFLELDPKPNEDKEKEQDVGFSFFKGKWRPASPAVKSTRKLDVLPHLSLDFQEPKAVSATPDLGLLFTTDQILSDAVIGQRRLNPLEALVLVQACSRAIIAKGLETLGIMHPHWYSASYGIQRRVISHFIYLANLENVASIPSPASPTSPISAFEVEVNDTFSPYDIAAILRWGLRHLQIEGDNFGTDDGWYKAFLEAEGAAGYPPKAFSDKLAPLLPTANLQLLTAALEIFSSLAAHAEVNGTSGSKLCKTFGLWLLTAHRVEDKDDWKTFYARWERTGRMLEHLFLSRIRDESTDQRMPIRLLELVRKYPYTKGLSSPTTDLPLLPRPPFTTRLHDALFVRIEIELPYSKHKPSSKLHPLLLLADAFSTKVEEGEYADLWAKITAASKDGDSPSISNVFTDDTIRFLSLVPEEPIGQEVKSPTFSLVSPVSPHKRSLSADDVDKSEAIVAEHPKLATEPSPTTLLSPLTNGIGGDWAQFSTSGFLEVGPNIIPLASTLLDTDIEKTIPPEPVDPPSRRASKRSKAASPSSPRKSVDLAHTGTDTSPEAKPEDIEEQKTIIKASQLQIIQFDEAFVDFWSDSLLDPISADWPTFIICKLKSSLVPELTFGVTEDGRKQKTIQWLVLEQVYAIRTPPVPSIPVEIARPRPSSPSTQSMSGRRRFSFWNVSRTVSSSSGASHKGKKKEQELKVGEMGELLEEESKNETKEPTIKVKSPIFRSRKSLDIAQKSIEAMRKSVVKPTEKAKIDEETAAVAAVATGVVVASTAAVIGLPTDEPSLVEAVTAKAEVDHCTDTPAIEPTTVTEAVVPSPEATAKSDAIPLSTSRSDVVSSPEAKVETGPLESEIFVVESTVVENAVSQPETMELQSKLEPQAIEAKHIFSPVEETTADIVTGKTSDSAPVHVAAQHPHEVAAQEVSQPSILVAEDVLDDKEGQVEATIASTKLEGFSMAEGIEANGTVVKEAKHDSASALHDVTNNEPEIETGASTEPVPASSEQSFPAGIAHDPETTHSDEPAAIAEGSPEIVLDANTPVSRGIELQSELEQESLAVLPTTAQEIGLGVVLDSEDASTTVITHEVEALEGTAETRGTDASIAAPTTVNDVAAEFSETEQPVVPATEGDSIKHENEGLIEAARLATTEDFSSMDKVVPDIAYEAATETGNKSVESGTTLNIEPQWEHEADITAPAAEDTIQDIHTSLRNDSTPLPLPLEPEIGLIKTEVETETQVEAASIPLNVEVQPDHPSLTETAANTQQDIKVETQVDDSSNIEDKNVSELDVACYIETKADTEGTLGYLSASNTEKSQATAKSEPEVDFVAPAEEEPSVITQVEAEDLSPRVESEVAISQSAGEAIPIPEDETASVVNFEGQIVAPVNEVTLLPSVEGNPETSAPIEPSHESTDDDLVGSHIIPEVDAVVPETQVLGEGELAPTTEEPVASVELNPGREATALPPQELPVDPEHEQSVTHEGTTQISNLSVRHEVLPISEVNVSFAVETEPELLSTNSASEEKLSTLEVEEQHALLSSESHDAVSIGPSDDTIPLATAEPGPEVVAPVSGTLELQAQQSVEETTEKFYAAIETPSENETEVVIPMEGQSVLAMEVLPTDAQLESATTISNASSLGDVSAFKVESEQPTAGADISVESVKAQLEAPSVAVAEESDCTTEVEPQIISASVEESPAQIEEERLVLAALQDDTSLSEVVYTEPLEAELVSNRQSPNDSCSRPAQELAAVADSLEQSTLSPIAPPIDPTLSSGGVAIPAVDDVVSDKIPAVTNAIPNEFAASAPPHEEYYLEQSGASADSRDSDVIVDDTQNMDPTVESVVIPSHEPAAEGIDILGSTAVEGALTDIDTPINATIPAESITVDFEHIALTSDDTSKLEAELPVSNGGTLPVDNKLNPEDNTSITIVELDTGPTHVDEMLHEVIKDKDVAEKSEPSIIVSTSDVVDEHEQSTMQSHLEAGKSNPVMSELTNPASREGSQIEMVAAVISSTQDKTAAEMKVDNTEEVNTEASNIDQGNVLSTQTGDVFDQGASETDPTMEQVKRDAQIEGIDPAIQQATVSEESNPEKSSATVEDFNGYSDINASSVEPSAGVEPTEESPVNEITISNVELPVEVIQEPSSLKVDEVAPEPQADVAVPAIITDELSTTETPAIDKPVEELQVESEAKDIASDTLEDLAQTDTMATDKTVPPTRDCEAVEVDIGVTKEPSESAPVLPEVTVEQPETLERTTFPLTASSITAAETEAGQTTVSAEPIEEPKRSAETSEIHGIPSTAEPSVAETFSVVASELAIVVPEDTQIENDIAQPEEDLVNPPPTDNPVQEEEVVAPFVESKEAFEIFSTAEPSVTETSSVVVPELATVIPEDTQIENGGIAQTEGDLVDPPPTDNHVELKESVEISSPTEPSVAETPSVIISEPATVVPKGLQIEDDGTAQPEEDPVSPPPTDNPVQEAITPLVEFKEATEIFSTAEPSVAETPSVVFSEPATAVVPEDIQIENGGIAPAEEDLANLPTDNSAQEETVAPVMESKESVEISSAAEPSVAEIPSVIVSEPATLVPEDVQIDNGGIAQAEEDLADPPTDNSVQETMAPVVEFQEVVEISSAAGPSVAEIPVSEPATLVPEDLQVENDAIAQPEEDSVNPPPPTDNPVQEETVSPVVETKETVENFSTAQSSVGETRSIVVPEPVTTVPEDPRIENDGIAQPEEDLVNPPPPTDILVQVQEEAVAPLVEFKEAVENFSTAEPSTLVPEDLQTENGGIAQPEEDLVDPPPLLTDNTVQEEAVVPLVESNETVEKFSTAQPSVGETPSIVVSEPATVVPEDLQIENGGIIQAGEDLVDPPTENSIQEQTLAPVAEFKEAVGSSSAAEPSMAEIPSVIVSEPATLVSEGLQIENAGIAQAEEDLVDPPPTTGNPIQEELVDSHVEVEELVEISLTVEPPVGKAASVVSEPASVVPEDLQIKNGGIVQAEEEDLVDPPPPTDNSVQEEATALVEFKDSVEISSLAEPSVAEIASVVSEPSTEVPGDLSINNGGIAQAEAPLRAVETEPIDKRIEGQVETAIPEAIIVEEVSQTALSKVETQAIEKTKVEAPEIHVLNGNEHSAIATKEDNIEAEPKVIEPILHPDISPTTLEAQSTTD